MKHLDVQIIKNLTKGQSFKINGVEYVFIKNVDADSIVVGNRETEKQEQINLTFLTNKNSKTMKKVNVVSVKETVEAMNVKDLRKEASSLSIKGYSKMVKVDLQVKVIEAMEVAQPKSEGEKLEQIIVDLAKQKVDVTIAKDQATDQDSKNFQSDLIKDLNDALKVAKANLNAFLNPVVEVTKTEKAAAKKAAKNKVSKAQIAKDKKFAKNAAKENEKKSDGEVSKTKAKSDAKGLTMAEELDKMIAKGGKWEKLCKNIQAMGDERGFKTKYTKGTFKAHIKFRVKQNSDYLTKSNVKVADEGIEKIK